MYKRQSHASFITEACASRLKCACFDASVSVNGVGDIATKAKKVCHLSLETLKCEVVASNHAFIILAKISSDSPRFQVLPEVKQATKDLLLADPSFDVAAPLDALFGADIVAAILLEETIPLGADLPVAVRTRFGFVIMGRAPISLNCALTCACLLYTSRCV